MNKKAILLPSGFFFFLFLFNSCTGFHAHNIRENAREELTDGISSKAVVLDHRTDRTTGALPAKAEAEKQAEEIKGENAAGRASRELRRREMEEKAREVQKNVSEDRTLQREIQQQR